MKKLIILFSALALINSCAKLELTEQIQNNESDEALNSGLPEVIYASVADGQDSQTRTIVDGKTVLWQPGDAISFFYGNHRNAHYAYQGESSAPSVEFDYVADGTLSIDAVNQSRGVYPYNPETNIVVENGVDKINVIYPANQTYAPNSFGKGANIMIATGKDYLDDKLSFRNASGYLVIKLYGKGVRVKNIALSSVNDMVKIAGPATIVTDDNNIPVTTMSDEASTFVTLDCSNGGEGVALGEDAANATEFWFALPPVNIEGGIKIVVTDMNNNIFTQQTTKTVNITRNDIQPMAAIKFVSNTPSANRIWYTLIPEAMLTAKTPIVFENGDTNPFDATITAHYYDSSIGKFVIEFDKPVKTIKKSAFKMSLIYTIDLPEGLETIGEDTFSYTQLKEITIPGSVNTIETQAFSFCGHLKSIKFLPSSTQTPLAIACRQFELADLGPFERAVLTSIDLNRELLYVKPNGETFEPDQEDEGLFYSRYVVDATSVTIGNQVRTFSNYMFCCLPVKSLTIPGSVTTIGNDVFNGCTALSSLTFDPSPTGEALTLGYNTDGLDEGLFVDCPLQTVNLNRQLKYAIENDDLNEDLGIFSANCLANAVVNLGGQARTLLPYMFSNSGIVSLKIPASVEEIMDNAFYNSQSLTSIRFEAGTTPLTIGFQPGIDERGPFYQSPLTSIYVNRELVASESYAAARDQSDEGIFSSKLTDAITTVILQGNVNTISEYMFSGVPMETIWIPKEVTKICKGAFYNCSKLYGMTLAHSTPPTLIEDDPTDGGAFKGTLLNDADVQMRWIALEDGSDANVRAFKGAPNWAYYAYIIKPQIKY